MLRNAVEQGYCVIRLQYSENVRLSAEKLARLQEFKDMAVFSESSVGESRTAFQSRTFWFDMPLSADRSRHLTLSPRPVTSLSPRS
jgi:hypothetical protein